MSSFDLISSSSDSIPKSTETNDVVQSPPTIITTTNTNTTTTTTTTNNSNNNENLNKEFEELLHKLAIEDPEKRKQMLSLPDSSKKVLLEQHKTDIYKSVRIKHSGSSSNVAVSLKNTFADVKSVIASISNSKIITVDIIKSLRVHLYTADRSWIQSFLDNEGVEPLLNILGKIESRKKKRKDLAILEWEILRCLAALMKIKIGMDFISSYPKATNLVVLCLESQLIKVKTLVLEMLAAIAVTDRGHGAILTSMIYFKEVKKEDHRYSTLVQSLKSESNKEYLITCMSFINCIISSPSDLGSRIEIRKAFLNLKILKYIESLRTSHEEERGLVTQLDVFEEELATDEQLNSTQGLQVSGEELFSQIYSRVTGTPSQQDLIGLLSHFQRMASSSLGLGVWKLYSTLAHQLEEELNKNADLDINTINLSLPEPKKSGLFSFGKSKSPSSSPSLLSSNSTSSKEYDKLKLKKDNEEKQKTIDHLLRQLNTFSGGQDINKWMSEREEKNKMISQLMSQVKLGNSLDSLTNSGGNQQELKNEIEKLKIELEGYKNGSTPSMNLVRINSTGLNDDIPIPQLSITGENNNNVNPISTPTIINENNNENNNNNNNNKPDDAANSNNINNNEPVLGIPPPPPPPPISGTPPPPPPGMGGPPPPPPPPPGMKKAGPAKPIIKPSVKMRNFNWVAMKTAAQNTFWDKVDENSFIQSLDKTQLETLFSAKMIAPKAETIKSPRKVSITVIDMKKANNCAIMLQHFKIGNSELKKIQQNMDERQLTLESAQYLLQFVPSKEDIDAIKEYSAANGGDTSSLGAAEQYMLAVMDIPKLEARLKSYIFKLKYNSLVEDMKPDIKAVKQASIEIKSSKKLHDILKYILAIGNYVNGSTTRGGAFGFKLETLSKMRDAKSNDGKLSLLHFLAKTISEKSSDIWNFGTELLHLEHASEVSFNNIISDSVEIKRSLDLIEKEYISNSSSSSNDSNDKFTTIIIEFQQKTKLEFIKLEKEIDEMNKVYEEVTNYFGDSKLTPPDVFFSMFNNFLEDLEKANIEYQTYLKKLAEEEEKDQEYDDPEKGGLGDLTSHIRSGQLFKDRRMPSNLNNAIINQIAANNLKGDGKHGLKSTTKSTKSETSSTTTNTPAPPSQSLLKPTSQRK